MVRYYIISNSHQTLYGEILHNFKQSSDSGEILHNHQTLYGEILHNFKQSSDSLWSDIT